MPNNTAKQERIDVFKDSVRFKNKKRIINISNTWPWMVYDCGYKLNTIARDYDMRLKMLKEFHERYQFDAYHDYWTRNPLLMSDALGGGLYDLDDDSNGVNIKDFKLFDTEDYNLLLKDYKSFLWTKIVPNKFPNLKEGNAIDMLKNAAKQADNYLKYCNDAYDMMSEKYGTLSLTVNRPIMMPFYEILFCSWRGIKNISIDLRRHHDLLKEVCDTLGVDGLDESVTPEKGSTPDEGIDIYAESLGHIVLNNKQYEELYYPQLKKIFDYAEKYDKIILWHLEGMNDRFYEYLQEAPKGHFVYFFENDDIFKVKKLMGDKVCLAGGMPCNMLYNASKTECVDYSKKLVNEIGYDGAYMFSQDKMMSYPNDCKRENLLAVNEFVANYRL